MFIRPSLASIAAITMLAACATQAPKTKPAQPSAQAKNAPSKAPASAGVVVEVRLNKYTYLTVATQPGAESVKIFNDRTETTSLKKALHPVGNGSYATADGLNLNIRQLKARLQDGDPVTSEPVLMYNTGDWQVTVSGTNADAKAIKEELITEKPTSGVSFVCYGKKIK